MKEARRRLALERFVHLLRAELKKVEVDRWPAGVPSQTPQAQTVPWLPAERFPGLG
ncbi:hypothetical protein ACO2I3_18420 [Leptospira interrogans]